MKMMLSEIIAKAAQFRTHKEKIEFLQKHDSQHLRVLLHSVYNPEIKFLLPDTDPPYKKSDPNFGQEVLYSEMRKLYLFIDGGNPNLSQSRREQLFIQLLEAIHPDDARLMLAVKNKKFHVPGMMEDIVRKAFPGLLPPKPEKEKKEESVEKS